jgi:GNAT superfamily N-acetyltransferase
VPIEPIVRPFREEDRAVCAEILADLHDWFGLAESNAAYIAALGQLPTAVALADDGIAGFAAVERHNPDSVELHVIAVRRKYHNRGIGSALLSWAEDWTRQQGATWFHVKTRGPATPDPEYEKTRKFYLARGFAELFETLELWGPEDAALIMVKKL